MRLRVSSAWAACAWLLGCAGHGDGAGEVPAIGYAPCDAATRLGSFSIVSADDHTAVEGRVASAVVPANVPREVDATGGCRLLTRRDLFCDPPCGVGDTCGENGACVVYPATHSVGVVTVSGLAVPLAMSPTSLGSYSNGATAIPHPGFSEGDVIALTAPGEELPGFALEGRGVAALGLATESVELARDAPLVVAWTPAHEPSARVRLVLELAHHGGIGAAIECDGVDDDGRFEVPAELVSALLDLGVAGFPTLTVTRRTADSVDVAGGCVELDVLSEVVVPVQVPGVTSCSDDDDCAPGTTCGSDLTCGDPAEELPRFSFFVTSYEAMQRLSGNADGFGGDLRFGEASGLAGADKICSAVAESELPGAGVKRWHAFLSATDDGAGHPVNAIDRIGAGPWYDRHGRLVASDREGLLAPRPRGDPAIKSDLPNERGEGLKGQPGPGPDGTADNHDVLTGSNAEGELYAPSAADTCEDWTSRGGSGRPRVGHSWPATSGQNWIEAHPAAGCAAVVNFADDGLGPDDCRGVGCGGGYGAIYCFAEVP